MSDAIESPHIVIESPSNFPKQILDEEVTYLESLNYKVKLRENELYGRPTAMSWATLVTAFVVYLTKPYFEAFLKEAGKEHYLLFKKWLIDHVIDRRKLKVFTITSSQSPNKEVEPSENSRSISIRASIHSDLWVTVLVNDIVEDNVLSEALVQVLDELLKLYEDISKETKDVKVSSQTVKPKIALYLIMNTEKQSWELLNQEQMIARHRK